MKAKKMDIQLKQNEIEQAVRNYVSEKVGINLAGKNLGIQFSMTRGAGGLIANLSISDSSNVEIPGFTDRDADVTKTADLHSLVTAPRPDATVAASAPASTAVETTVHDVAALTETSVPAENFDAAPEAVADAAEIPAAAEATTTNLFS